MYVRKILGCKYKYRLIPDFTWPQVMFRDVRVDALLNVTFSGIVSVKLAWWASSLLLVAVIFTGRLFTFPEWNCIESKTVQNACMGSVAHTIGVHEEWGCMTVTTATTTIVSNGVHFPKRAVEEVAAWGISYIKSRPNHRESGSAVATRR